MLGKSLDNLQSENVSLVNQISIPSQSI